MTASMDTLSKAPLPVSGSISRLRYFFGQLITQRDLEAEQAYHVLLQRLLQRQALGVGTVAGLGVVRELDGEASELGVFLRPGLGIDADGRELILEQAVCVEVANIPEIPASPGDPPLDPSSLAADVQTRFGRPFGDDDVQRLLNDLIESGLLAAGATNVELAAELEKIAAPLDPVTLVPGQILRDYLFSQLVGVTHLGLRYREAGAELAPTLLDASECGAPSCSPTRTLQGVEIVQSASPFPLLAGTHGAAFDCLSAEVARQIDALPGDHLNCHSALCQCILEGWAGLPPAGTPASGFPVLPLARVCWNRLTPASGDSILSIDNCRERPLAPGVPTLRALVEVLTQCLKPTSLTPRLVAIEPANGSEVSASATEGDFTLRATASVAVQSADPASSWKLFHYPETGSVSVFPSGGPGPNGRAGTLVINDNQIELTFAAGGPGDAFPTGTYVWRLSAEASAPGSEPIVSTVGSIDTDAEPNPPPGVPSGDGLPGGVFEARFVVT